LAATIVAQIGGISRSRRNADASTDNAVGPQDAQVEVGDVHRAALALAVAGGLAQQLGHHQLRITAFGQAMAVTAMGAGDIIVAPQGSAGADGHGFLTDVGVGRAPDSAVPVLFHGAFVKITDQPHPIVYIGQVVM